jgi:hypothetical protein
MKTATTDSCNFDERSPLSPAPKSTVYAPLPAPDAAPPPLQTQGSGILQRDATKKRLTSTPATGKVMKFVCR